MAKPENCNYSSSGSYCNCSPYCHITLNNTHTRAQLLTALVSAFNICCGELFARNEWGRAEPLVLPASCHHNTYVHHHTQSIFNVCRHTRIYRQGNTNKPNHLCKLPWVGLLNPRTLVFLERALLYRAIQTNNHFMHKLGLLNPRTLVFQERALLLWGKTTIS